MLWPIDQFICCFDFDHSLALLQTPFPSTVPETGGRRLHAHESSRRIPAALLSVFRRTLRCRLRQSRPHGLLLRRFVLRRENRRTRRLFSRRFCTAPWKYWPSLFGKLLRSHGPSVHGTVRQFYRDHARALLHLSRFSVFYVLRLAVCQRLRLCLLLHAVRFRQFLQRSRFLRRFLHRSRRRLRRRSRLCRVQGFLWLLPP
jgi:hypothetical protein